MDMRLASGRAFTREDLIGPTRRGRHGRRRRDGFWERREPHRPPSALRGRASTGTPSSASIADVRAYDMTQNVPNWIDGTDLCAARTLRHDGGRTSADRHDARRCAPRSPALASRRCFSSLAAGLGGDTVIGDVQARCASILADAVAAPAATTSLLVTMAGLALVLGCIGVYGVLSFLVSRQTQGSGHPRCARRRAFGTSSGS